MIIEYPYEFATPIEFRALWPKSIAISIKFAKKPIKPVLSTLLYGDTFSTAELATVLSVTASSDVIKDDDNELCHLDTRSDRKTEGLDLISEEIFSDWVIIILALSCMGVEGIYLWRKQEWKKVINGYKNILHSHRQAKDLASYDSMVYYDLKS